MAGWIVPLVVLLFGLQIFAIWRTVKRAMWIHRTLRDPQQLRGLLSSGTLDALREAGLDPATPDIRQIQKSPELQRLLAADLRKNVSPQLLNPFSRIEPREAAAQAAHLSRPPPIDAASGSGPRTGLLLLLLGLAAGALAAALVRF